MVGVEKQECNEDEEQSFTMLIAEELDVLEDSSPFQLCTDQEDAEWYHVYREQIIEWICRCSFTSIKETESHNSISQEAEDTKDIDDFHNARKTASVDNGRLVLLHFNIS